MLVQTHTHTQWIEYILTYTYTFPHSTNTPIPNRPQRGCSDEIGEREHGCASIAQRRHIVGATVRSFLCRSETQHTEHLDMFVCITGGGGRGSCDRVWGGSLVLGGACQAAMSASTYNASSTLPLRRFPRIHDQAGRQASSSIYCTQHHLHELYVECEFLCKYMRSR